MDLLFQSISGLTSGLYTDIETAILGVVGLFFLVMGINLLVGLFDSVLGKAVDQQKDDAGYSADQNDEERY